MSTPGAAEALQDVGGVVGGPAEQQGTETPLEIAARSPLQLFWRRLKSDKLAVVALVVITLLILIAILAPLIVKVTGAHPPNDQNSEALDEFGSAASPNWSAHYYMGTDDLGRDIFSRVLYGARISLLVAFITTIIAVVFGTTLGMLAGYYRGWLDSTLSRIFDVMLAFPVLLLALGLGAACSFGNGCIGINYHQAGLVVILAGLFLVALLIAVMLFRRSRAPEPGQLLASDFVWRAVPGGLLVIVGLALTLLKNAHGALITPGLSVVIFIIAIANIPYLARIIRGQVLSLREKEFVEAARSLGASDARILFRHIVPNLVAPIIVFATLLVPQNILFEAALSFLGVGVQAPTASWGAMIASAVSIFDTAWWYMTFPGVALLICVLSFNLVGDGLQDALNPRSRK